MRHWDQNDRSQTKNETKTSRKPVSRLRFSLWTIQPWSCQRLQASVVGVYLWLCGRRRFLDNWINL